MIYVPPTTEYTGDRASLFLAGGISDCDPWQTSMVELLAGTSLAVLNPRRAKWVTKNREAAEVQIGWEFRHLRRATARLFWFPCETVCPIALYELGGWTKTYEPLFVGMDPAYPRRFDLEVQLRLARPDIEIVLSLEELAKQVMAWEATL